MRTKKALMNSAASLLQQLVAVICGFILPRLLLSAFGSEVNGAVSSIAQFLSYISLLEAGVGGVTRAALYKPLAEMDVNAISAVANATQNFFHKLSYVFLVYASVLSICFKYISHTELSLFFTASLVLVTAISTFAQYNFGITNSIILHADQRLYIATLIQIATTILNTIISAVLIKLGFGIHFVKLCSTIVFVLRPVLLNYIVRKQYHLDRSVPPDNKSIEQRWNGLGQHIAFFLHNNADVMVTTIFLGLEWVSVYNVYYLILNGVRNIVVAFIGGTEAAFGSMIAKNEKEILDNRFHMIETLSSSVVVTFFSAAGLLLIDFVKIYTSGISDIEYVLPTFGVLFTISEGLHCIKQEYHALVLAAGHYKETQVGAFVEAGLNIVLSIVFVELIGITGIIYATIISTAFRTIDYAIHLKYNILFRKIRVFIKRMAVTILNVISVVAVFLCIPFPEVHTYFGWILKAIPTFLLAGCITVVWNALFYKEDLKTVVSKVKSVLAKK